MTEIRWALGRFRTFSWWGLMALMMALLGVAVFGPMIEQRFWPVVTNAAIIQETGADDGAMRFRITYIKERDCRIVSLNWFGIERGGRYSFALLGDANGALPPLATRPEGQNISRPFFVTLTSTATHFIGEMEHHCPWQPWTTKTRIGPFIRW